MFSYDKLAETVSVGEKSLLLSSVMAAIGRLANKIVQTSDGSALIELRAVNDSTVQIRSKFVPVANFRSRFTREIRKIPYFYSLFFFKPTAESRI